MLSQGARERLTCDLAGVYDLESAETSDEAFKALQDQQFDILVTDFVDPGSDGMHFLVAVARTQPDCVRMVVSSNFGPVKIASGLFFGHRYFERPCDVEDLGRLLLRLAHFRDRIGNEKIRALVGGLGSLPAPPEAFLKLQQVMSSPSVSTDEIATVIEQYPAVTAKLLQIVNSAQFGLSRKVISAAEAVNFVGLNLLRVLVLAVHAVTAYQERPGRTRLVSMLWDHSLEVAAAARQIARSQKFSAQSIERAFLAALLHDIGRIVIAGHAPEEMYRVSDVANELQIPLADAQTERLGATFADIGAYLLALWGIDDEVISIVQCHERLGSFDGSDVSAAAALHVAHCATENNPSFYPLDTAALEQFGFSETQQWPGLAFTEWCALAVQRRAAA